MASIAKKYCDMYGVDFGTVLGVLYKRAQVCPRQGKHCGYKGQEEGRGPRRLLLRGRPDKAEHGKAPGADDRSVGREKVIVVRRHAWATPDQHVEKAARRSRRPDDTVPNRDAGEQVNRSGRQRLVRTVISNGAVEADQMR